MLRTHCDWTPPPRTSVCRSFIDRQIALRSSSFFSTGPAFCEGEFDLVSHVVSYATAALALPGTQFYVTGARSTPPSYTDGAAQPSETPSLAAATDGVTAGEQWSSPCGRKNHSTPARKEVPIVRQCSSTSFALLHEKSSLIVVSPVRSLCYLSIIGSLHRSLLVGCSPPTDHYPDKLYRHDHPETNRARDLTY